jgi:hypothetical protein
MQPREDLGIHLGDAARRVRQSLTARIFTDSLDDQTDSPLDSVRVECNDRRRRDTNDPFLEASVRRPGDFA